MKYESDKIIMTVAEFLSGAQTSDLVSDQAADDEQEAKIKDARARRDEEWSLLANQVVGGETAMFLCQSGACSGVQSEGPSPAVPDAPPLHS